MFRNAKHLTAVVLGTMLAWSSTAQAVILVENHSFEANAATNEFPIDWVATNAAKTSSPSGITDGTKVVYLAGLNQRVLQALHHEDTSPLLWSGDEIFEVTATLGKPTWRLDTDNDGVRFVIGQYHEGVYTELASSIISIDHLLPQSPSTTTVFEDFTVTFDTSVFDVAPTPGSQVYIAFIAQKIAAGGSNATTASAYVDNVRVALVPEPASLVLMGTGALLVLRRRRAVL